MVRFKFHPLLSAADTLPPISDLVSKRDTLKNAGVVRVFSKSHLKKRLPSFSLPQDPGEKSSAAWLREDETTGDQERRDDRKGDEAEAGGVREDESREDTAGEADAAFAVTSPSRELSASSIALPLSPDEARRGAGSGKLCKHAPI